MALALEQLTSILTVATMMKHLRHASNGFISSTRANGRFKSLEVWLGTTAKLQPQKRFCRA
jgi:hypothetical protein